MIESFVSIYLLRYVQIILIKQINESAEENAVSRFLTTFSITACSCIWKWAFLMTEFCQQVIHIRMYGCVTKTLKFDSYSMYTYIGNSLISRVNHYLILYLTCVALYKCQIINTGIKDFLLRYNFSLWYKHTSTVEAVSANHLHNYIKCLVH